ncbi:MAG: pyrroloquinoline quinone biosynthesis protein PqqB [Acidobacteriota bacterium]
MKVLFLGTAAGGGLPQWNCNCPNCLRARENSHRITPRLEASLAVSSDGCNWVIIDAPLDLRYALSRFPFLSVTSSLRGTPIHSILITHGDLNHCAGLLTFRGPVTDQRQYLKIFTSSWTRQILLDGNQVFHTIKADWATLGSDWTHITGVQNNALEGRAISVAGKPPTYSPRDHPDSTLAIQIRDTSTGSSLLYAPVVAAISEILEEAMQASRCVIFDGTFFSDTELVEVDPHGRRAQEIGHIPVEQSLPVMAKLQSEYRLYSHINNTNPLNDPGSKAFLRLNDAGILVAHDNLQIDV